MGISIHYSGKIADKQKLPQLIEEVQEIATVHGWNYQVYEPTFPISTTQQHEQSNVADATHDDLLYGILHQNFERNGMLIKSFGESINNEQRLPNEDVDAFIKRIIEDFRKKSDLDGNIKSTDCDQL